MKNKWEVQFEVDGKKLVKTFQYFTDAYFYASRNLRKNPVIYQCNGTERKIVDWRF